MMFRRLDEAVLVAGQLSPGDIADAARLGVTLVVNNRPDGEEPDQPAGAEIGQAARSAGLEYCEIPVAGGIAPDQVEATARAIDGARGEVLLFCRSGTRSTWLWALARASRGDDPDELVGRAAEAGFDLSPLLLHLRR